MHQIIIKTAIINNHDFVRQSDLFSVLFIKGIGDDEKNKKTFYSAIDDTMFKELNFYLNDMRDFKQHCENLISENKITHIEQEHSKKLEE